MRGIILFFIILPFLTTQNSVVVKYQSTTLLPNLVEKQSFFKLHFFDEKSYFVFQGRNNSTSGITSSTPRFSIIKDLKARKIYQPTKFGTIEDSLNLMSWQLDKLKKVVLGYPCKRAICTFRGRDYEAFYTEQIPISNGPFKFGGLPGLILEVSSTDHFIKYEAIQIDKSDSTLYEFPGKWLQKIISFETMLNMEDMANLELIKKQEARSPIEKQGLITSTISIEGIEKKP
ncbi:GLPGLI family protein [Aquirufa sp. ROCK-SH2]